MCRRHPSPAGQAREAPPRAPTAADHHRAGRSHPSASCHAKPDPAPLPPHRATRAPCDAGAAAPPPGWLAPSSVAEVLLLTNRATPPLLLHCLPPPARHDRDAALSTPRHSALATPPLTALHQAYDPPYLHQTRPRPQTGQTRRTLSQAGQGSASAEVNGTPASPKAPAAATPRHSGLVTPSLAASHHMLDPSPSNATHKTPPIVTPPLAAPNRGQTRGPCTTAATAAPPQ
ncbi:hypothetical protein I4F81_012607 [Pyropia yezoensis]|uniref:Uncharacterized protein n=1 Tax=Pyropia yezoensis TaxID=2788 RepID=A0ACC3CJ57_PYRYE|nr:hypothetical protein I4F81_012607 [Neopyropia yezoensis]